MLPLEEGAPLVTSRRRRFGAVHLVAVVAVVGCCVLGTLLALVTVKGTAPVGGGSNSNNKEATAAANFLSSVEHLKEEESGIQRAIKSVKEAEKDPSVWAAKAEAARQHYEMKTKTVEDVVVDTQYGKVTGTVEVNGDKKWKRFTTIPYAAPPVGPLRFAQPVPPASWEGVRAKQIPVACAQVPVTREVALDPFGYKFPLPNFNEDCLYLNVFAPAAASPTEPRAVMIWIHGGTFVWGGGLQAIYQAEEWAARDDIVIVSINYRLGVFGGLYYPPYANGNMAMADQRAAMRWVRDNIAAFGGDASKVTIAGNSAGAYSVGYHMLHPDSQGLFSKAILQSSPYSRLRSVQRATDITAVVLANTTCAQFPEPIQCLMVVPAAALVVAQLVAQPPIEVIASPEWNFWDLGTWWQPVVDEKLPSDDFLGQLRSGKFEVNDVLMGSVRDEGLGYAFIYALTNPELFNPELYLPLLVQIFGLTHGVGASLLYPATNGVLPAMADILTDYGFQCPARYVIAPWLRKNVYVYEYKHVNSFASFSLSACIGSVCHASELELLFGTLALSGDRSMTPDEASLSEAMGGYWASFVRTGRPESAIGIKWPKYNVLTRPLLALDWPLKVERYEHPIKCGFWATSRYQALNMNTSLLDTEALKGYRYEPASE